MAKKTKIEKEIKKRISFHTVLGLILGLIIGCAIGYVGYYFLSNDEDATVSLNGSEILYYNVGDVFVDPGIEAYLGDKELEYDVTSNVDMDKAGTYYIVYRISDYSVLQKNGYDYQLSRIVIVREVN